MTRAGGVRTFGKPVLQSLARRALMRKPDFVRAPGTRGAKIRISGNAPDSGVPAGLYFP